MFIVSTGDAPADTIPTIPAHAWSDCSVSQTTATRTFVAEMLTEADHLVMVAIRGVKALEQLATSSPNFLVRPALGERAGG